MLKTEITAIINAQIAKSDYGFQKAKEQLLLPVQNAKPNSRKKPDLKQPIVHFLNLLCRLTIIICYNSTSILRSAET